MPGPIQKHTENTVESTPLVENSRNTESHAPISVSSDWKRADGKKPPPDGLFIETGDIDE
jgi:hypothetical protein